MYSWLNLISLRACVNRSLPHHNENGHGRRPFSVSHLRLLLKHAGDAGPRAGASVGIVPHPNRANRCGRPRFAITAARIA